MAGEVFETRTQRVWLGDDGIVRGSVLDGAVMSPADARENVAAVSRAAGGARRPLLVDLGLIVGISRDARLFYAGEEAAELASAVALLVRSPVARVLGSFFLGLNRSRTPTRLFATEDEALEWLRGHL